MIKFLKRQMHLFFKVATERLMREKRKIRIFDLVSPVPNPTIKELYMVYAIDDHSVDVVPWKGYSETGKFMSTLDNVLAYDYQMASDNLYKVTDKRIDAYNIIQYSTPGELKSYGKRISQVCGIDFPLLGLFLEKNTKHVMLIVDKQGPVEDGHCLICDVTKAHSAGLTHKETIYHIAKTRDVVEKCVIRPFCLEDIVHMYSGQWHRVVITDLMRLILEAVAKAETKFDYYSIYAKGLTSVEKIHGENSTMESGRCPDPQPKQPAPADVFSRV